MVNSVELTADAYLVCLTHALSTEKEEVMGLLLGEVRKDLGTKLTMVLLVYLPWRAYSLSGGNHSWGRVVFIYAQPKV